MAGTVLVVSLIDLSRMLLEIYAVTNLINEFFSVAAKYQPQMTLHTGLRFIRTSSYGLKDSLL